MVEITLVLVQIYTPLFQYTPLRLAGIYIRKVLPGSPAAENGKIQVGDRLLCVNGKSIVGADYQR
jgi:C-terminal processing protease CtpA/Prc